MKRSCNYMNQSNNLMQRYSIPRQQFQTNPNNFPLHLLSFKLDIKWKQKMLASDFDLRGIHKSVASSARKGRGLPWRSHGRVCD